MQAGPWTTYWEGARWPLLPKTWGSSQFFPNLSPFLAPFLAPSSTHRGGGNFKKRKREKQVKMGKESTKHGFGKWNVLVPSSVSLKPRSAADGDGGVADGERRIPQVRRSYVTRSKKKCFRKGRAHVSSLGKTLSAQTRNFLEGGWWSSIGQRNWESRTGRRPRIVSQPSLQYLGVMENPRRKGAHP